MHEGRTMDGQVLECFCLIYGTKLGESLYSL
jgi:hypothetical protein